MDPPDRRGGHGTETKAPTRSLGPAEHPRDCPTRLQIHVQLRVGRAVENRSLHANASRRRPRRGLGALLIRGSPPVSVTLEHLEADCSVFRRACSRVPQGVNIARLDSVLCRCAEVSLMLFE